MTENVEEVKVKPSELFQEIKQGLKLVDSMLLSRYIAVANKLLVKAEVAQQKRLIRRLNFRINTLHKELNLVNNYGVNRYVERSKVFDYIEFTKHREVKISSIADYLREIPDEAIEKMAETREVFDDFLILFTDYTGETAQQAEELVVEKDPILFGIFYDDDGDETLERFYFLYDWEDEYCDLTLDKLIMEYKDISDEDIVNYTDTNIMKATKDLREEAKDEDVLNG